MPTWRKNIRRCAKTDFNWIPISTTFLRGCSYYFRVSSLFLALCEKPIFAKSLNIHQFHHEDLSKNLVTFLLHICRILWKKSAPQEVQDLSGYESSNTFARRILNRFPNRETVDCQNFAAKLLPFSPEIPTDPSSPPFLLPRNLQIFLSLDRRPSFFHPKFRHCRVSRKAHLEKSPPSTTFAQNVRRSIFFSTLICSNCFVLPLPL